MGLAKALPATKDSWSFLYVEHARVERDASAVVVVRESGTTQVPVSALSVLMLGPGTTVTHAAMALLTRHGASVVWCGDEGARFYASGSGETRRANNLLTQAEAWATRRTEVAKRLYRARFDVELSETLTIEQLRGMEGVRVRDLYASLSKETGVAWAGRDASDRSDWLALDPINQALSIANACLYGVCHAALAASGFSTGLGFIHTGKMLAFVYDVADLYKTATCTKAAFEVVGDGVDNLDTRVRTRTRELLTDERVLGRIVGEVQCLLAPEGGA